MITEIGCNFSITFVIGLRIKYVTNFYRQFKEMNTLAPKTKTSLAYLCATMFSLEELLPIRLDGITSRLRHLNLKSI